MSVEETKQKQPSFIPVAALTFVNILALTILMPVLPFIIDDYGAPTWVYGLLLASYPAGMFFGSPILGELSDRIGRRPVLMISQAGTLLSWVVFGSAYFIGQVDGVHFAWPIAVLLFARIFDGLTGGNVSVINAYLADITPQRELTKQYGKLGAVTGFAVIAGPAIGGYTSSSDIGYLGMALAAILISSITLVLMGRYLKESLHNPSRIKRAESRLKQINIISRITNLKTRKGGKLMLGLNAGFSLVMAGYTSIIALFLIDRFRLSQIEVGNVFLIIGLMLIFNQYVIVPRLTKVLGDIRTFLVGLLLLGGGLIAITLTDLLWQYMVLYYVLNLGISFLLPTSKSLIAQTVDADKQGAIQGIDESLRALSRAVMPIIMGFMYGIYAFRSFYPLALMSFILVAIYVSLGTQRLKVIKRFIRPGRTDIGL